MTEIPTWLLILLVETLALLALILGIWIFLSIRRKRNTRKAVDGLVEQIRKQSKLRLEETGSFLEEKYRFEGDELQKAVEQVDKAEKLFFQRVLNLYLKRDDERIKSLDAWVAELIGVYKSLSPVMPAAGESAVDENTQKKMDELERSRQALEEELKITKTTMSNMIAEFGNMFGGGKDNELEQSEVVEKVVNPDEVDPERVTEILEGESTGEVSMVTPEAPVEQAPPAADEPPPQPAEETVEEGIDDDEVLPAPEFENPSATAGEKMQTLTEDLAIEGDDEIDELLDGIDLSDGEELEPPK